MFKTELKRSVISKKFLFSVIFSILVHFISVFIMVYHIDFGNYEALNNMCNKHMLWYFSTEIGCFVVPLAACIPYSSSLVEEKNTSFINFVCVRDKYLKYIKAKILSVFTSGFLSIFISVGIFLILISLSPYKYGDINIVGCFSEFYSINPNLYYLAYLIVSSILGGVFAIMGLAISVIVNNSLVATLAPSIYYFLVTYVFSTVGLVWFEPASINCYFVRPTITPMHIFGQLIFYFFISIMVIIKWESKEKHYEK